VETIDGGGQVLYLYGVVRRGQGFPADAALRAVACLGVAALVEPVCAEEFSAATLDEKMTSIEWVARLAQKHEAVLEGVTRLGAVVPARLCTLFSSEEALRTTLAENEAGFLTMLEWVEGREEWGLKMLCAEDRLRGLAGSSDQEARKLVAAIAEASPGHAFVLGKKREARLAELTAAGIEDAVDAAIEALEPAAAELRSLPASAAAETGGGRLVLNLAALVDKTAREAFHSTVSELAASLPGEAFTFEMSGPWPPYNFCTAGEEA